MDLGRRYTPEEIQQIQALIDEGLTNRQIAARFNRSEAGIRNIRYRNKLKTETTKNIQTLLHQERELNTQISRLQKEVEILATRREKIQLVLRVQEQILNKKLQKALTRLKDTKPELFQISAQEQLGKLAGELSKVFIKWLIA